MTLRLANQTLTRYVTRSGYAAAELVPLDGALGEVAASFLRWLDLHLTATETLVDVVLKRSGQVATAFETTIDDEGNETQSPTAFRPTLFAAVSVTAPLGSRTFVVCSESLPDALRDGLLQAWEALQ